MEWSHGHSTGLGVIVGLMVAGHVWTVALFAFLSGLIVGSLLHLVRAAAAYLNSRRPHYPPSTRTPW